jgi:hypothetical protein
MLYKTPSSRENTFFKSYSEHVRYFPIYYKGQYDEYMKKGSKISLMDEFFKELTIFESLHDQYEAFDLLPGTVVPSIVALIAAAVFFIDAARITFDPKSSEEDELRAEKHLSLAGILFVTSIIGLVNNLLSLITRPLMTMSQGWKKDDEKRFAYPMPEPYPFRLPKTGFSMCYPFV